MSENAERVLRNGLVYANLLDKESKGRPEPPGKSRRRGGVCAGKSGDLMEWKEEITIPAEKNGWEPGKFTICRLHENLLLLLIDIRSYQIPEIPLAGFAGEDREAFYINYCTRGRCELSMKDGSATFLERGELAIDFGHAVHTSSAYRYPSRVYQGVELCFFPGEELDRALRMGGEPAGITTRFQRRYMEQDRLLITQAEARAGIAFEVIKEDAALGMPREALLMDVYRLFLLLENLRLSEGERRSYYTDSQVRIARLAWKELAEHLNRRIPAAELAAKFGVSESCLKNYFRGVYGKGYYEALHELRMNRAAGLLAGGGVRVGEAAAAVGYASQSRFAKAFKEYFGATPTEYSRRTHLEGDGKNQSIGKRGF